MRRSRSSSFVVAVALIAVGCSSSEDEAVSEVSAAPGSTSAAAATTTESPDTTTAPETTAPPVVTTAAPVDDTADEPVAATLEWAPCEDAIELLAATECATLQVPRDHDDPDGELLDIAVARIDSASDDDQIGSLVFNPGGPGGSGIDFLTQAAATIPPEVQERFDLVSFDPRGVGASTAVECDIPLDDEIALLAEGDDAAWEALVADAEQIVERCTPETRELLPWVGTNNAARDMDLLRAALGDEQLTYVGYSYGTQLGTAYATLFPDRVRALVLDGAVSPQAGTPEFDAQQAAGFDRALERFAASCDADEDCLLRELGPTLDVIAGLREEIADVGSFPVDEPGRRLTPGELDLAIAAALYSVDTWPFLVQGLYVADVEQDGSILQVLTDGYLGRRGDGTYGNIMPANFAIRCADEADRPDPDQVRADAEIAAAGSRYFDEWLRASPGCIGAPPAIDPYEAGRGEGTPPILVIGTTGDPATPYEWAVELADFLANGELFTVEGDGHTAYGSIECVAEAVNAYLIDLELPAERSCIDDADADIFVPAGESEGERIIAWLDCMRENGLAVPEIGIADLLGDRFTDEILPLLDPTDPDFLAAAGQCIDVAPV